MKRLNALCIRIKLFFLFFVRMNSIKNYPSLFFCWLAVFFISCNGGIKTNQQVSSDTLMTESSQVVSVSLWTALPLNAINGLDTSEIRFSKYKLYSLDSIQMQKLLTKSPRESSLKNKNAVENLIKLPRPDTGYMTFNVYSTAVMDSALEAKYPSLKTYGGQGIEDPTAMVRLDFNQHGFHAYVICQAGEWIIQPAGKGITHQFLICFFKHDAQIPDRGPFEIQESPAK